MRKRRRCAGGVEEKGLGAGKRRKISSLFTGPYTKERLHKPCQISIITTNHSIYKSQKNSLKYPPILFEHPNSFGSDEQRFLEISINFQIIIGISDLTYTFRATDMVLGPTEPDIPPKFAFEDREKPYQKVTIKKMPEGLYKELEKRAAAYTLSVPVYCRAVLECALDHQHLFAGPVKPKGSIKPIAEEVNIPVKNKEFLNKFNNWRPYGHRVRSKMALAILSRHLEVMKW